MRSRTLTLALAFSLLVSTYGPAFAGKDGDAVASSRWWRSPIALGCAIFVLGAVSGGLLERGQFTTWAIHRSLTSDNPNDQEITNPDVAIVVSVERFRLWSNGIYHHSGWKVPDSEDAAEIAAVRNNLFKRDQNGIVSLYDSSSSVWLKLSDTPVSQIMAMDFTLVALGQDQNLYAFFVGSPTEPADNFELELVPLNMKFRKIFRIVEASTGAFVQVRAVQTGDDLKGLDFDDGGLSRIRRLGQAFQHRNGPEA